MVRELTCEPHPEPLQHVIILSHFCLLSRGLRIKGTQFTITHCRLQTLQSKRTGKSAYLDVTQIRTGTHERIDDDQAIHGD